MRSRLRGVARLGRDPNLRRLGIASVAYSLAEFGAWITILVHAFERGGIFESGLVGTAMLLPAIGIAPLATRASLRLTRPVALAAAHAAMAVFLAAAALSTAVGAPVYLLYASMVGLSLAISWGRPLQTDVMVRMVRTTEDLAAGNVSLGLIESVGQLAGPLLVAGLLPFAGAGSVFGLLGLLMGLSAFWLRGLHPDDPGEDVETSVGEASVSVPAPGMLAELVDGFRWVVRGTDAGVPIGLLATREVVDGAIDVLAVAIAFDLLATGESGAALLNAAFGVGLTLGALLAFERMGSWRLGRAIALGAGVTGLALAAISRTSSPALVVVLLGVAGVGALQIDVAGRMLLQRVSAPRDIARSFAALESWSQMATAIGTLGVSGLVAGLGIEWALVVLGLVLIVCVWAYARRLRDLEARYARPPTQVLEALRAVEIFEPLGVLVIEQLARAARRVEASAGEVLIRQGERAGPVYVVLAGEVSVTVDGRWVRRQGPGEFFGEIALLHSSRRTATVVAETPVLALAIEPEVFLVAVKSHRHSLGLVRGIAAQRVGR